MTKEPKAVNYACTEGRAAGHTQYGIYELDGASLKLCYGTPGDGRTFAVWSRQAARGASTTGSSGVTGSRNSQKTMPMT